MQKDTGRPGPVPIGIRLPQQSGTGNIAPAEVIAPPLLMGTGQIPGTGEIIVAIQEPIVLTATPGDLHEPRDTEEALQARALITVRVHDLHIEAPVATVAAEVQGSGAAADAAVPLLCEARAAVAAEVPVRFDHPPVDRPAVPRELALVADAGILDQSKSFLKNLI